MGPFPASLLANTGRDLFATSRITALIDRVTRERNQDPGTEEEEEEEAIKQSLQLLYDEVRSVGPCGTLCIVGGQSHKRQM